MNIFYITRESDAQKNICNVIKINPFPPEATNLAEKKKSIKYNDTNL
jgi:hypothetical protein